MKITANETTTEDQLWGHERVGKYSPRIVEADYLGANEIRDVDMPDFDTQEEARTHAVDAMRHHPRANRGLVTRIGRDSYTKGLTEEIIEQIELADVEGEEDTEEANTAPIHCLRCGRVLRSAKSLATGYGPTCTRKIKAATKAAVVAQYKPHQVAKAEELIEQGGLIPLRGQIYLAVSSDGSQTYKTHRAACSCPAGIKGLHPCKHRIAAHILSLAA